MSCSQVLSGRYSLVLAKTSLLTPMAPKTSKSPRIVDCTHTKALIVHDLSLHGFVIK